MAGLWDTSMKRLIGERPRDFVTWLRPNGQIKEKGRRPGLVEKEVRCVARYSK